MISSPQNQVEAQRIRYHHLAFPPPCLLQWHLQERKIKCKLCCKKSCGTWEWYSMLWENSVTCGYNQKRVSIRNRYLYPVWWNRKADFFYIIFFCKTKWSSSTKMYHSKHKTIKGKQISGKKGRQRRNRDRGTRQKELSSKYFLQQRPRIRIRSAFPQKEELDTD